MPHADAAAVPEWLWVIVVGVVVVGLMGAIWSRHETTDKERDDRIWDQIGRDSDAGMRKTVHDTSNKCSVLRGDINDHEHRLNRIEIILNGRLK